MSRRAKGLIHRIIRWPWWLRWIIAIPMLALGGLGLMLPVMPGWVFIIPGIILLFGRENRVGRWVLLKTHRMRRWWQHKREARKQARMNTDRHG